MSEKENTKIPVSDETKEMTEEEKQQLLDELIGIYKKVLEEKDCVSLKTLAVTGSDLIAAGMKPGKEIGEILNRLLQLVIDNPECNTKDYLMKKAMENS